MRMRNITKRLGKAIKLKNVRNAVLYYPLLALTISAITLVGVLILLFEMISAIMHYCAESITINLNLAIGKVWQSLKGIRK